MKGSDESILLEMVAHILGHDVFAIDLSSCLEQIGWDSLSQLSFVAELDSKFGLSVDTVKLQEAVTIEDLFQAVIRE